MSVVIKAVSFVNLPRGWSLEPADTVTISDEEWEEIQDDDRLVDLVSFVSNSPGVAAEPAPSWRDIQRAVFDGEVGEGGGAAVPDFFRQIEFTTASDLWSHTHNQNTFGIDAVTFDSSGVRMLGEISWPDSNTIRVKFFHPQTGTMRVFT